MKNLIEIESYEIKTAKTGHSIPVVNGVHIHSAYNPIKEAQGVLEQYRESLKDKKEVLVLGLGFGYHINELVNYFEEQGVSDYLISVIEPCDQIVKDAFELNPLSSQNIKVYSYRDVDRLYTNDELISTLLRKPLIIPHTSSFNLFKEYFRAYLTYEAPNTIKNTKEFVKDTELYDYICRFNEELMLQDIYKSIIKGRNINHEFDYALMAFGKICEQVKTSHQ